MIYRITLPVLFLFFSISAQAALSPVFKEAMQRGYQIEKDSVVFPDGTKCLLADFNEGICGQGWMTTNYCIPEGNYVWDEDRCCKGLAPYLKGDGQATCQPIKKKKKKDEGSFLDFFGVSFWMGVLIVLGGFGTMAYSVSKARKKQRKNHSEKKD
jgi:hypothetical protein